MSKDLYEILDRMVEKWGDGCEISLARRGGETLVTLEVYGPVTQPWTSKVRFVDNLKMVDAEFNFCIESALRNMEYLINEKEEREK